MSNTATQSESATVPDDKVGLTLREVSELTGIPFGALNNHTNLLPRTKVGRRFLYRRNEIVKAFHDCPEGVDFFDYLRKMRFRR